MSYQTDVADWGKIYWRCRRGMLELDLLLAGYFERHYGQLSTADQAAFNLLLSYPDDVLLEYLLGRMQASDPAIRDVVNRIRCAT